MTSWTNGMNVPGPFRSWEQSSREREPGASEPGNERAQERKFHGANWPEFYWPIRSGERTGSGAKRL